jgi:hypothetical protein
MVPGVPGPAPDSQKVEPDRSSKKVDMIMKASWQEIRNSAKSPEEARSNSEPDQGKVKEYSRRPEARKASASIQVEGKSGRVWTVSAGGKAVPVSVVIGITDGTFSEIISGELSEGTDVIVGEAPKNSQANWGTASPFGGGPGGVRK